MRLDLLDAPLVGKLSRNLSDPKVLGTYSDEPSALAAVRQHVGKVDPDRLVLTLAGTVRLPVAEGAHLAAWALVDQRPARGFPRARRHKDGDRLLCGWCGGVLAAVDGSNFYVADELIRAEPDTERSGLPTWLVRKGADWAKRHPEAESTHRDRQQRAMATSHQRGAAANLIGSRGHDVDVALLECPRCAPRVGATTPSILVPRLDSRSATY